MGFASRWAVLASPRWQSAASPTSDMMDTGTPDTVMAATVTADMLTPATPTPPTSIRATPDGAQAHNAPAHPAPAHSSWFFSLLSPRVLFALLVGFGAAGLVAASVEPWRLLSGVVAAALFEGAVRSPLLAIPVPIRVVPAVTLDSALEEHANGDGLRQKWAGPGCFGAGWAGGAAACHSHHNGSHARRTHSHRRLRTHCKHRRFASPMHGAAP